MDVDMGKRGRSGGKGGRKGEQELLELIEKARTDYDVGKRLERQVYYDMMGVTSRLHKGPFDEPKEFYRPGNTPSYMEFRAKTSALNVAKIMLLQHRDHGLHQVWAHCMSQRRADTSVNGFLGNEVGSLVKLAEQDEVVTVAEANRIRRNYEDRKEIKFAKCHEWDKEGECARGAECRYMHTKKTRDLGRHETIFTEFVL